jgi:hypothetical protein
MDIPGEIYIIPTRFGNIGSVEKLLRPSDNSCKRDDNDEIPPWILNQPRQTVLAGESPIIEMLLAYTEEETKETQSN